VAHCVLSAEVMQLSNFVVEVVFAQLSSQAAFSHSACSCVAAAQAALAPWRPKHPPRLSSQFVAY
jgi:hypothetical protein